MVDARAGPGTKSIAKIKNKAKEEKLLQKRKHKHKKAVKHNKPPQSPGALSDDVLSKCDFILVYFIAAIKQLGRSVFPSK